jgi:hypothetical protein
MLKTIMQDEEMKTKFQALKSQVHDFMKKLDKTESKD